MPAKTFADLGVSKAVADALTKRDIASPFAVQELVIPDVLAGRDVLVKSPTGSGKTLAFAIPMAERLEATDPRPSALILAPTRELAAQIVEEAREVCPLPGAVDRRRLRRRRHPEAGAPGPAGPHPRGDARPAARPARAAVVHARQGQDPRPRRGRPDARHGLQARRHADRRPDQEHPPDAALLGDARGRGRPGRCGLHDEPRPPRAQPAGSQGRDRRAPLPAGRPRGQGR